MTLSSDTYRDGWPPSPASLSTSPGATHSMGPPTVQAALFKPQCSGGNRGAKYPRSCHYTSVERHPGLWPALKSFLEWESRETDGLGFGCACSSLYLMPFILLLTPMIPPMKPLLHSVLFATVTSAPHSGPLVKIPTTGCLTFLWPPTQLCSDALWGLPR